MVLLRLPAFLRESLTDNPTLLDISSDPSSYSIVAFHHLRNSDHVFVWGSIDLASNSKGNAILNILVLIGTIFRIIWKMFLGRIC